MQTIYSQSKVWCPRNYYIFEEPNTGTFYLGQHIGSMENYFGSGVDWTDLLIEQQTIPILRWHSFFESEDAARLFLSNFEKQNPEYWKPSNKKWANKVPETTKNNPFQAGGSKAIQERRVKEGTHNFLGGEIQREHNQRRLKDGTHHLLSGEIQREHNIKRTAEGRNAWQKQNRKGPIGNEFNSETAKALTNKRLKDGTHNLQGANNPNNHRWECTVTGKITNKRSFTIMAKKRMSLNEWPYELKRIK